MDGPESPHTLTHTHTHTHTHSQYTHTHTHTHTYSHTLTPRHFSSKPLSVIECPAIQVAISIRKNNDKMVLFLDNLRARMGNTGGA